MGNIVQVFPRFRPNAAPSALPFGRIFRILYNILETATGIDRGSGPGAADGLGWHFGHHRESLANGDGIPRPFDISSIDASSVTVTRCWYSLNLVWITREEEPSLELSGVLCTLCAKINTQTGEVALSVTPLSAMPTDEYAHVPIYVLSRATESEAWRVTADVRPGAIQIYGS
jgi:hypothetical protein